MLIEKAIFKINSNASFVTRGNDINTCTFEWTNGTVEISRADIKAMMPIVEQELKDAETKRINDKASANAKLKALGLTDDEIEALK